MITPDRLDELLGQAARSGSDTGTDALAPEELLEYAEGRAAPDVEAKVENALARSKSQRELWRMLQDEHRPTPIRYLRWVAPFAAAAAVLLALAVQQPPKPVWQIGPLPPGLSEVRGNDSETEPPKYGPEHHPEVVVRTHTRGALPELRVYRIGERDLLYHVESATIRRSDWVFALRFSAHEASAGRAGSIRLLLGPADEDWSGRTANSVRPIAARDFVFVP